MNGGLIDDRSGGPAAPVVVETRGPGETARLASDFGSRLRPGDLVLLEGEVGAGKSTFARAAMRALGVEGPIPSPTFTIGRAYRGRLPVSHIDLYRLGPLGNEIPDLLGEYLDPAGVTFVEWPGSGGEEIRSGSKREIRVGFEHVDEDVRRITVGMAPPD